MQHHTPRFLAALAASLAAAAVPGATVALDAPAHQQQPADAAKKGDLRLGPYVTRESGKDWVLRSHIRISSRAPGAGAAALALPPGQQRNEAATQMGSLPGFNFQTMTVVFPVLAETASSIPSEDRVEGWLKADGTEIVPTPRLSRRQSGVPSIVAAPRLAQFATRTGSGPGDVRDGYAREIEMQVEVPMTCYKTRFDEQAALRVNWPTNDWPAPVKAVFQPQVYIETSPDGKPYNQEKLKNAIANWCGPDPRAHPPARLAKMIAAEVVRFVQPSGDGRSTLRTGDLQGFALDGIDAVIETGRGTEFDLTCLLTSLYRAAGLPARILIGVEAQNVDRKFLEKKSSRGTLRSWVEFALYDEDNNTLNWVPVDIVRIRKQSSRPQPIDRPWKYFGTHDDLNLIAPIASHFHPPTSVIAYSVPGLWGWMVTPAPPAEAYQSLSFDAYRDSIRPNDPRQQNPPRR